MTSNRNRGAAYRNDVLLHLHERGFTSARRAETNDQNLSGQLRANLADIEGTPVALMVRAARDIELSGPLTLARSVAETSGRDLYGYVLQRRGHPIDQHYFISTVACLQTAIDLATKRKDSP